MAATPAQTDSIVIYDLDVTTNKRVTISDLASAMTAAGIDLNDLQDVDDGTAHTNGTSYAFQGDGTNLDVVELNLSLLNDVTVTPTSGHVLYYGLSGSPETVTLLSAAPGSTSGVQPQCDALDDICTIGPTTAADQYYYSTAAGTLALGTITAAGRALIDDADTTAQRTTLGLVAGGAGDIWVEKAGDTMTGNLVMTTGTDITLPDLPTNSTDAANKAYVDAQAGGLTWLDPVWYVDLASDDINANATVDLQTPANTTTNVAGAETSDMYIVNTAAVTFTAVGVTGNSATLSVVGSPAIATVPGDVVRFNDDAANGQVDPYWEYIGHTSDTSIFPTNAYWGVSTVTGATAGGTFANTEGFIWQMTANGTAGNNDATWAKHPAHSGSPEGPLDTQTFLVSNPNSGNAFKQFTFVGTYDQGTYPGATDNKWLQVGATASITDGVGLSFSGNVLNVNLGAGIVELPSDEVGIELHDASTGSIILTTDGTTRSTASAGKLHLLLPASSGLEQDISGLRVDVNNATAATVVTADELLIGDSSNLNVPSKTTIANFLSDLDIVTNAFTSSGLLVQTADDTYSTITIANATNGGMAVTNGDGSGNITLAINIDDLVALGATPELTDELAISDAGTEKRVTVAELGSAISSATELGDLGDVTITSGGAGDILVHNGGSPETFENKSIQFNYDSTLHGGAATSHTVTHNLGQQFINITVYIQSGSPRVFTQVIPQSVTLTSANVVTVTFNSAIDCVIVVSGVPGVGLA